MNCKRIVIAVSALSLLGTAAMAQESKPQLKWYGFIRNYAAVDTRESVAGTEDFFFYLPKDEKIVDGEDLNARTSARFAALTSRLGLDVTGYEFDGWNMGAKIEADFYSGVSGVTGTATLRLRQAYATIAKNDLSFKVGQAWHPMAADQPHVFSLETGAPFNAFSRTPQVLADASFGKNVMLSAAALWQMQYLSQGPDGKTADYIKYSCVPEMYLGLTLKSNNGFLARIGTNLLSIKPRRLGTATFERDDAGPVDVIVKVSDRITTLSPYLYLQYKSKMFEVKAKTIFSHGGEHMNLMSGYGISEKCEDGHYEYTPFKTSSTWASMSYGKKWQATLMGGYIKNLGTVDELANPSDFYFSANAPKYMNQMWRVIPAVCYNAGKFTLGLEYNYTAAQYGNGKTYTTHGLSTEGLHTVENHRVQMMVKFSF